MKKKLDYKELTIEGARGWINQIETENEALKREKEDIEKILSANEGRIKNIVDENLLSRAEAAETSLAQCREEKERIWQRFLKAVAALAQCREAMAECLNLPYEERKKVIEQALSSPPPQVEKEETSDDCTCQICESVRRMK